MQSSCWTTPVIRLFSTADGLFYYFKERTLPKMVEVSLDPDNVERIYVNSDHVRYIRKHPHGLGTIIHFDGNHSISVATSLSDLQSRISLLG